MTTNPAINIITDAGLAAARRARSQDEFLGIHHHLINPRLYTTQQYQWRETQMLVSRWDACTVKTNMAKSVMTVDGPTMDLP